MRKWLSGIVWFGSALAITGIVADVLREWHGAERARSAAASRIDATRLSAEEKGVGGPVAGKKTAAADGAASETLGGLLNQRRP